jgi:hypothetical protein
MSAELQLQSEQQSEALVLGQLEKILHSSQFHGSELLRNLLVYLTKRAIDRPPGPCMAGSLTGAVASQRVTEARDGGLRLVGNQLSSAMASSPPDCESDGSSRDESRP